MPGGPQVIFGGGGGGVTSVESTDSSVAITNPTTVPNLSVRLAGKPVQETTAPTGGQALIYTATAGLWVPKAAGGALTYKSFRQTGTTLTYGAGTWNRVGTFNYIFASTTTWVVWAYASFETTFTYVRLRIAEKSSVITGVVAEGATYLGTPGLALTTQKFTVACGPGILTAGATLDMALWVYTKTASIYFSNTSTTTAKPAQFFALQLA
ncbi:MAG: hypothetical protein M0010_00665 [Actinomycetota bacterium]|nr:hypothetical protein [Actinomycetota bacterium]